MKKSIASLLLVLFMGIFVSAAYSESLMDVKCSTDYEKMELKIDITSQFRRAISDQKRQPE